MSGDLRKFRLKMPYATSTMEGETLSNRKPQRSGAVCPGARNSSLTPPPNGREVKRI